MCCGDIFWEFNYSFPTFCYKNIPPNGSAIERVALDKLSFLLIVLTLLEAESIVFIKEMSVQKSFSTVLHIPQGKDNRIWDSFWSPLIINLWCCHYCWSLKITFPFSLPLSNTMLISITKEIPWSVLQMVALFYMLIHHKAWGVLSHGNEVAWCLGKDSGLYSFLILKCVPIYHF